ncbi:hypothetical protein B0H65DRAFT_564199 [Neurospora tetraspora]|uniref:Uncharacterized protein n=1 Tax=Neurospora tetraspora TaxID=94610 RepID=A0AAE0JPV1_9PEZI|nr:hypothetical protein B0H65DRAFT_564199 [Neurospora tetraspora]
MNQNREHQSPTAEAQSPAADSHNGQSTTTPEVEDQLLLDYHHPQEDQEDLQPQHQHLPQPQYVESEANFGSDSSTDVEDKYPTPNPHAGKNEIFIKEKKIRVTTEITIVKVITIRNITKRKDGIYRGPKITVDSDHIAGSHTERKEVVIEETESGWITDDEAEAKAEDEGDKAAPGGDNTTTAAGSSPSNVDNAGN